MLGNLLGGFIVILIGVNILPSVADSIDDARYINVSSGLETNVSGAAGTVLGLTTIFFALGIMASGVALAVMGMKNAGVL